MKMEKKILKEWPSLPKRQAVIMDDGGLCLVISGNTEREKTSLLFYFGEYNEENYKVLEKIADLLFKTEKKGLCALTACTLEDTSEAAETLESDSLTDGLTGHFDSRLYVENGRIIYTFESCIVPVTGTARYDLGVADKNNIKLKRKLIRNFESNSLMPAFFITKHHYIDNVMPFEPVDDEE